VARWLDGEDSSFDQLPEYSDIPNRVAAGEIYWVNVLYAGDSAAMAATQADVANWVASHKSEHIPVLLDNTHQLFNYMAPTSIPAMLLLDNEMTILSYETPFTETWDVLLSGVEDG